MDSENPASYLAAKRRLPTFRRDILSAAENLFPGYFALVMATGIVSIASYLLGLPLFAKVLVGVNWAAYAVLWALTIVRLTVYPRQLIDDLFNHQRAPGFFTLVASTCVLGSQTAIVVQAIALADALWFLGLGLWAVVMYSFFTAVTIRARKPSLATGINGAWLIAAVATQSIVVLRGILADKVAPVPEIQFLCLGMFLVGWFIYLSIIPLIFYRLTFVRLSMRDFSAPYWINMGALAISSLAGSILITRVELWPVLRELAPFLKGFTVLFWAAATWWIPFLLALDTWRYLVCRDRPAYHPQLWGMVFPLGMYTTATFRLSQALNIPSLSAISNVFIYVAIAAWIATSTGLLAHLWRAARKVE